MEQTNITQKQKKRLDRLFPVIDGKRQPKYVRCYDNLGTRDPTLDRFTIVFTGNYRKRNENGRLDGSLYVSASAMPTHPQGVYQHEESDGCIDRPAYGHLGKKVPFMQLPEELRNCIIRDYIDIWNLPSDISL